MFQIQPMEDASSTTSACRSLQFIIKKIQKLLRITLITTIYITLIPVFTFDVAIINWHAQSIHYGNSVGCFF